MSSKKRNGEEHSQPSLNLSWFPRAEVLEDFPEATVQELATVANRQLVGRHLIGDHPLTDSLFYKSLGYRPSMSIASSK